MMKCNNLYYFFIFILLFGVFQFDLINNLLFNVNHELFLTYQNDSQSLVVNSMKNNIGNNMLQPLMDSSGVYYFQQFGLQGVIFSFLAKLLNVLGVSFNVTISICQSINSVMMAILLTILIKFIFEEFGFISLLLCLFALCFFDWTTFIARNLYWCAWTWFLPIIFVLYFKNDMNKFVTFRSFIILVGVFFIKALMGYEFMSTITLAPLVFIIYLIMKNAQPIRLLLTCFLLVFLSAIVAVMMAIMLQIIHAYLFLNDYHIAINYILGPIQYRTGLGEQNIVYSVTQPSNKYYFLSPKDAILASFAVSRITVLKIYFFYKLIWGNTGLMLTDRPFYFLTYSGIFTIYIICVVCSLVIKGICNKPILLASMFSLLCPLSWYVLAKPHSFIHVHINAVLLIFPILMNMIFIGDFINRVVLKIKDRIYKNIG